MQTTTATPTEEVTLSTATETVIRVPKIFWLDHIKRGNTPAENEKQSGHSIWLTLSDGALKDLRRDAEYYAEWEGWDYYDNRRLVDSARRTVEAINKQTK